MCHRASDDRAWQCRCGYEFGQDVARTRELLRDQLISAKIFLAIFVVLDAAVVLGTIELARRGVIFVSLLAFVFLILGTGRSLRKIMISRESLRALAPKDLPVARVV
jgi:hypothetical protein